MSKSKGYFDLLKFLLWMGGVSVEEDDTTVYKLLSSISFLIFYLYSVLAIGDLFMKHASEAVNNDTVTYVIAITVGIIKCIAFSLNRKKISNILKQLDGILSLRNYVNGNDDNEQLIRKCMLITRVQSSVYLLTAALSLMGGVVTTLTTRLRSSDYHDWKLPYGRLTVLNITYSPNYEITWVYQCITFGYIGNQFVNIDLLIAAVLCHICFHLKILQNNLKTSTEHASNKLNLADPNIPAIAEEFNNSEDKIPADNLLTILKQQVEYHLLITNITKEVDKAFSILLLCEFLGTMAMQAFLVNNASLVSLTDVQMWGHIGELIISVLQVLMISFWSAEIMFEGEQVGYAAYETNFVGKDTRFQKSLILIMRRSQYPIRITAGFVTVSLASFTLISRSTYSYFMILRRYNLQEN